MHRPVQLSREQIEGLLPHRDPGLFLANIAWMVPREVAVAEVVDLGAERRWVPRTGDGCVPALLLVEAIAQAGAIAGGYVPEAPETPVNGLLGSVSDMRILGPARLGLPLSVRATVERRLGRVASICGTAFAGAEPVVQASLRVVYT